MSWYAEMLFLGKWVRLPGKWKTRDDAEWEVATWKQMIHLTTDPFRYVQE